MKWCLAAVMCVLVSAVGAQEPAAEGEGVHSEAAEPQETQPLEILFREMVDEARQIERMLSEVTDRESADRSVEALERMLTHMDTQLHELENFSFRHEQEVAALQTHMAMLTHISQNSLAAMQRLVEVNAYGSEPLLALFVRHRVDVEKRQRLRAEDMPHTQLYNELADAMEDVIYALNRVQSADDAAAVLAGLRKQLSATERVHHMLMQLVPPTTDEQKNAMRPVRVRLQKLFNELKKAIDHLQAAQCYGNEELDALLPKLLALPLR